MFAESRGAIEDGVHFFVVDSTACGRPSGLRTEQVINLEGFHEIVQGMGGHSLPKQSERCVLGLEEVSESHEFEVGSHKQQAAPLRISSWSGLGSKLVDFLSFIFLNVFPAFDTGGRGAKSTVFPCFSYCKAVCYPVSQTHTHIKHT